MKSRKNKTLLRFEGNSFVIPFILITSLFFMWGLANNMTDTLLAAFKRILSMSDFQTSWIQFAFYGSYFCLALPAAFFIMKFTYKSGILLGVGLFIIGALLFYPASGTQVYGHFLGALFILAGGLSVLETTANSYVLILGSPETATQRLNLAQSFNPLGSISGIVLSRLFILPKLNVADESARSLMQPEILQSIQTTEFKAVMGPYVGVGLFLILLWILLASFKMPKARDKDESSGYGKILFRLFKSKNYRSGVIAQFFYVGAQIGVWSYTIRYVMNELSVNEASASEYYIMAMILFTGSRFIFTFLMRYFRPGSLLIFAAGVAGLCTVIVIFGSGIIAVGALVCISAFMSLMFPTIYGISVAGLGADTKIAGSGLIMAILGGALLTAIQGQISDLTESIHLSFFVPLFCFGYIVYYGIRSNYLLSHQSTHDFGIKLHDR